MQNELLLPQYMNSLDQDDIDNLCGIDEDRIIACGINPHDKSLVFVSNKLFVRTIVPNGKLRPLSISPAGDGKGMWITFHGIKGIFPIDVEIAMKYSIQCMNKGELIVNNRIVCNVDLSTDI